MPKLTCIIILFTVLSAKHPTYFYVLFIILFINNELIYSIFWNIFVVIKMVKQEGQKALDNILKENDKIYENMNNLYFSI